VNSLASAIAKNIKEKPPNFRELPYPGPRSHFFGCDFMMGLGMVNLKSPTSAVAEIRKGNHQDLGSSLPSGDAHFCLLGAIV